MLAHDTTNVCCGRNRNALGRLNRYRLLALANQAGAKATETLCRQILNLIQRQESEEEEQRQGETPNRNPKRNSAIVSEANLHRNFRTRPQPVNDESTNAAN